MSNFSTNIVADNREKWARGQRLAADCREAKQIFANKHTLCKFLIDHNLHEIFHTYFLWFFASFKFKWIKSSHNNIHVSKEALKFTVIGALMTVNMRENTVARLLGRGGVRARCCINQRYVPSKLQFSCLRFSMDGATAARQHGHPETFSPKLLNHLILKWTVFYPPPSAARPRRQFRC